MREKYRTRRREKKTKKRKSPTLVNQQFLDFWARRFQSAGVGQDTVALIHWTLPFPAAPKVGNCHCASVIMAQRVDLPLRFPCEWHGWNKKTESGDLKSICRPLWDPIAIIDWQLVTRKKNWNSWNAGIESGFIPGLTWKSWEILECCTMGWNQGSGSGSGSGPLGQPLPHSWVG